MMGQNREESSPRQGLLSTWKEIAAYLGVNVRTAQKWEEERGLPVLRVPGRRGRVVADAEELAAWLRSGGMRGEVAEAGRQWWKWAAVVGGLVLAGFVVMGALWIGRGRSPSACDVDGDALIVKDEKGRELWRRSYGYGLTGIEENRKQRRRVSWIGDLDGDGKTEVLFLALGKPPNLPSNGFAVHCYSENGDEKWQFRPRPLNGELASAYPAPYNPLNLLVFRSGGENLIAVSSVHHTWFPNQVAVLTAQGQVRMEYWHSGYLLELAASDELVPGKTVLLAGGVSNGYGAATLAILEPAADGTSGVSREDSNRTQLPGRQARELARILFPRTVVSKLKHPYSVVTGLRLVGGSLHVALSEEFAGESLSGAEVLHAFGPGLKYEGAAFSSNYLGRRQDLAAKGLIPAAFHQQEEAKAMSRITWLSRNLP